MKVYLAGAISGLTYGEAQEGWRAYASTRLNESGIPAYSPLRAKDYLDAHGKLEGSYDEFPLSSAKGILTRDRWDVMTCDLVLMNLVGTEKVSIGSVMEAAYADAFRKPLVLVLEPENIHMHPMLEQAAGFISSDLDEALTIVEAILLPNGGRGAKIEKVWEQLRMELN